VPCKEELSAIVAHLLRAVADENIVPDGGIGYVAALTAKDHHLDGQRHSQRQKRTVDRAILNTRTARERQTETERQRETLTAAP
jgi:hypothetical protein